MGKKTFWDIIEKTLDTVGTPLSAKEIWDKANELNLLDNFQSTGKTPWATIAAYCYTDINNNNKNSTIIQTSERPAKFFLRRLSTKIDMEQIDQKKEVDQAKRIEAKEKMFHERDLHPILVAYTKANTHFKANLKTIWHESSKKTTKGLNEWLHPDLVGVYFPFNDYQKETLDIQTHLSNSSVKLFSFEIKKELNFSNLREYYFQTVSNSSWANEGYLVVLNIDDDQTLKDEIRRLNNAFGIGLIKLNAENVFESEILLPSRVSAEIDWDTVNRLASENKHFGEFLKEMAEDIKLQKVKSKYDNILTPEELEKHIKDKGIKQ